MNHTTMKATAVISEAWRSITSGAARLAPAVLALALTAAISAAVLAGCGSSAASSAAPAADSAADSATTDTAASADLLSQIRERGTITVAMEGTWAPWTYHDENDNLVGYDVEVATEIAKKLGVEPQFVEGEWDGLLAGLDAGRYDIMVNGVDITEERAEKYDFSEPYAYNRTAVITKGDNDTINSLEDLKDKKTANTISSNYAALAESYGATVTGVDDLNQTIELLLSGRIDAILNAECDGTACLMKTGIYGTILPRPRQLSHRSAPCRHRHGGRQRTVCLHDGADGPQSGSVQPCGARIPAEERGRLHQRGTHRTARQVHHHRIHRQ